MTALLAIIVAFALGPQSVVTDSTVPSSGASIAGHVTDAQSKPIDSYSVIVFSTDRTKWSPDSRLVMMVRPAQDGGFEVVGLAPGEYWVAAVEAIPADANPGEWGKPDVLERLSARATRVKVAEHGRYLTVLRLIRR
jgi:hypothetical protein